MAGLAEFTVNYKVVWAPRGNFRKANIIQAITLRLPCSHGNKRSVAIQNCLYAKSFGRWVSFVAAV